MPNGPPPPTERTKLRRKADRGRYDRETIVAILDEAIVCHVGFSVEGLPWVFPTAFARIGDDLYLHGAVANFALKALTAGAEACVSVTLLDGLVLARSAFHHSLNYRSVMVFGSAEAVTDDAEKRAALLAIVEHMVPGRSNATRPPTASELRSTLVVRIAIDEASAKVRTGGPIDEATDYDLPYWAGVLPLTVVRGEAQPDIPSTDEPRNLEKLLGKHQQG
jgi:nitroimidazol reductase NimA-like FMN-containing flavoprotein (pyridoxamine 5'-phosphate oxidase superfamily)